MNAIENVGGRFVINGKDTFLFGGEFHYFRVSKGEWRDRLQKLVEAGCNLVSTYIPWVWHEIREGEYDLDGHTREERDLAAFLELVKEFGLYCIVRPGPYIMAEVRYEGVPHWLLDRFPEIIARIRDGNEHPTRVASYRHPVFLKYVKQWYQVVNHIIAPMQITQGGPIIMYQLCNEIGMLHWVTNTSDYNSDTLAQFGDYLANKYKDMTSFNNRYSTQEASFSEFVRNFSTGLSDEFPSFHVEWGEFRRKYIKNYVNDLRGFAEQGGINVPFIINVHGFKDYSIYSRGIDYPIGLSQLYHTADFSDTVLAGDYYPGRIGYDNYHDLILNSAYTKAISRSEQPLFSAEFQSGRLADRPRVYAQDLDLNTRTCIAHGMNALNYYMFVAGENYENLGLFGRRHEWQAPIDSRGNLRPNYFAAQHLGSVLKSVGTNLLSCRKIIHTFVGFNPNDYMSDVIEDRDHAVVQEIVYKRDHFSFDGILRLLVGANIHFEAIDVLKPFSVHAVPTLWVFSTSYMEKELQERLVQYVQKGGKLIIYPELPFKDLQGNPCDILVRSLELGEWEVVTGVDTVDVLDIDSVMVRQRLKFNRYEGTPLAAFTRTGQNEVAAYQKTCGEGEVIIFGLGMGYDYGYQLDVIQSIAERFQINRHLSSDNPDISLVERKNGAASFIFMTNYDDIVQKGIVFEKEIALFDGEEMELYPRSGLMCLRDHEIVKGIFIEYATVEITSVDVYGDRLEMKVTPVGRSGSIKLTVGDNWTIGGKTEHVESCAWKGIQCSTVLYFEKR